MAKNDPQEYRATKALFIGRARAANPGDLVPAENVKKYGWEDDVELVGASELDINASGEKVLDWVGEDPTRAGVALEAEQAKGEKARKGLVETLEGIATAGAQV